MKNYQKEFIDLAIEQQALSFGSFTLKSGRVSPYFFNAGKFYSARSLAILGRCYAACIAELNFPFDILFGPAYKGIPIAASTAVALADHHQLNPSYAFNRKVAKTYGDAGNIVGAPLQGKILVVDDVITAGTAFRECYEIITKAGATVAGLVVAVDRQERGLGQLSALEEIHREFKIPVTSLIKLDDLIVYLQQQTGNEKLLAEMFAYKEQYGQKSQNS